MQKLEMVWRESEEELVLNGAPLDSHTNHRTASRAFAGIMPAMKQLNARNWEAGRLIHVLKCWCLRGALHHTKNDHQGPRGLPVLSAIEESYTEADLEAQLAALPPPPP